MNNSFSFSIFEVESFINNNPEFILYTLGMISEYKIYQIVLKGIFYNNNLRF